MRKLLLTLVLLPIAVAIGWWYFREQPLPGAPHLAHCKMWGFRK